MALRDGGGLSTASPAEAAGARRQALLGHAAMLTFSALVAGSFSLGSMAANEIAPAALNALRFLIAGALIGTIAHATVGLKRVQFEAPWRYAVLGGLFAIYFVLMFEGLKTAPPVSTAAVFTLTPVMSAGFGYLLLRQITTPRMALALSIGAAGALWVIFRADLAALLAFRVGEGEMIYFWGCVAHAIYTPMVRRLNRGEPAVVFSFGMMVAGFLILALWGWQDILATDWLSLPPIVWITILYTAVFASAATFVLLQFAALRLPSAKVMAYTYLTPSWVILWEIALGRGAPPALVLPGIALTVLSLLLLLRAE
ncbi:DMT family transporter [Pseudoruegeria sp. SHC-113]|uniref:DMT family transporter n=1 Tax=Pseudoruegeria sp. SHC-113 TaxID=2855439 RepID=UPI0021BB8A0E|nr:DMT family transporter [Pseudoruegeria sp. SHC-113]MCT8159069.1 DMT family transporter [Pseudoruegeria sp. SHC-113]